MLRHQEKATIISKCIYNKGQYRSIKQKTIRSGLCYEASVTLKVRGGRQGQTKAGTASECLSSLNMGYSRQDKLPGSKFKTKICFPAQKNNNFSILVLKFIGYRVGKEPCLNRSSFVCLLCTYGKLLKSAEP